MNLVLGIGYWVFGKLKRKADVARRVPTIPTLNLLNPLNVKQFPDSPVHQLNNSPIHRFTD